MLIDRLGISFDKDPDGRLALSLEGGHSLPRIIHSADATGKAIESKLITALEDHPNVKLLSGYTAVDLLTPSHHSRQLLARYQPESCCGSYLFNRETQRVVRALARKTILATGGLGQIFLRSTNPSGARGDGLAMAQRAGARVINAEFVQFHPTTLYREHGPLFLISEAVRGAGAKLVDENGAPFMEKYAPEWKDLAPRDVVARSILQEMLTRKRTNVFLDIHSHLSPARIKALFPTIFEHCLAAGVDITREPIPVVPAAHYFCGGVWTDDWGQTTLRDLYAVGEVACTGLHGANRLASTSLLEGLVWGNRVARHALKGLAHSAAPQPEQIPPWEDTGTEQPDPALIQQDMNVIKHIMWNYVGLVRTTRRLDRAIRELHHLELEIEHFYRVSRLTDDLIGLRNAVQASLIIAHSAWKNKSSIGCHFRSPS